MSGAPVQHNNVTGTNQTGGEVEVLCGPLINFQRMDYKSSSPVWHGSVLIVTKPTSLTPRLDYGPVEARGEHVSAEGLKLYQDPDKAFWRFTLELPLTERQAEWTYHIPGIKFLSDVHKNEGRRNFFVPAANESMRIMFHSCNGFSVGTDEDFWSGESITLGTSFKTNDSRSCTMERCPSNAREEAIPCHDWRWRPDL